jgi:methyltransferase-like protein
VGRPVAQHQAVHGKHVANLRHRLVDLNELERALLHFLDGRHDRAALTEVLVEAGVEKVLASEERGVVVEDPARIRALIAPLVEPSLHKLASNALLIA